MTDEETRATIAQSLRDLADKVESGEVASVFCVHVTKEEGSAGFASAINPNGPANGRLANLLLWVEVHRTRALQHLIGATSVSW